MPFVISLDGEQRSIGTPDGGRQNVGITLHDISEGGLDSERILLPSQERDLKRQRLTDRLTCLKLPFRLDGGSPEPK